MKKFLLICYYFIVLAFAANAQWLEQASGFATQYRGINHIFAVDQNIVWATAYDGSGGGAIIQEFTRTSDGGSYWIPGSISGATGLEPSMIFALDENTAWVPLYDGTNGGGKLMKTSDGGATWIQQVTTAFVAPAGFPNIVYFWDSSNGMCMGDPTGGYFEIYTTTDGGDNWTRVSQSHVPSNLSGEYGYTDVYSVVGELIWYGTNKGRIYHSTDHGYTWTVMTTPLSDIAFMAFANEFKALIAGRNATTGKFENLNMTEDGGATWQAITYTGNLYSNDLCLVPGTTNTFISSGSDYQDITNLGSSYSLDFCQTWNDFIPGDTTQYLALDFINTTTGWAGQFNTNAALGGMLKFVDNTTLTGYNNPSGNNGTVLCYRNVSYTFQTGDFVYTDPDSHQFSGIVIMSLVSAGSLKYAGTEVSLFTKCPDVDQLVFTPVIEEFGSPYTTFKFKVADETGAYSDQTYTMTINVSEQYGIDNILNADKLIAYPNPFHTSVNVTLPAGNNTSSIIFFDIKGKILKEFNTAETSLVINRNGLSNGVYYLKITGNKSYVVKLVIY
jgi:photosystem II stability/assembly factor-like uncharacterized protein